MNFSEWILYLAVVLLSTWSPGPAVMLSMSNAVSHGLRAAAFSSLGNVVGLFVLSGAAFLGIGVALQASSALFNGLKIAGAAYLIYLGVRKWRSDERMADSTVVAAPLAAAQMQRLGFTDDIEGTLAQVSDGELMSWRSNEYLLFARVLAARGNPRGTG